MSKAQNKSSPNAPVKKSHLFMVSSVVEVSETLAPADNRNYTYRGTTVAITCNGWDGDNEREYDGSLIAYCGSMEAPLENHCYAIKAKMIPSSESAHYKLYFEADHKILVGTSDTFTGELNNNTSVSGFGIISERREITDTDSDDVILGFVMAHTDYDPQARESIPFQVEYRIRPTPKMKPSQGLIQDGKETLVHGFIVDWDNEANRWIVTGLNVASGHEPATKKRSTPGTKVTPSGRVRPAKHVPDSSPTPAANPGKAVRHVSKAKTLPPLPAEESYFDEDGQVVETEAEPAQAGPSGSKRPAAGRQAKKARQG
ncbi:uncharacterized protein MELLADRAFT_52569 [Melampsora larici-populina 98AG31]|uniref:Uncharacterized protein n=1 Tax=Melampsora larici-populina (strain 98AG31 / pathotype 3-4-7) TaxID=747676 RepID=F4RLV2_MELLP|nr:uncharacterized protein MELLADRAFT_52569 [Melampsora larici-populina 98AG31]EGG06692.1 hypothetical protein MELLADRAFT_52569 [Melampsora larici-populina 98AG31]